MRIRSKILQLFGILALVGTAILWPVRDANGVALESIECVPDPWLTEITLKFSEPADFSIDSSGQRIDVLIQQGDLSRNFKNLLENEDIIKTTLAKDSNNLLLSLFLRRFPESVKARFNPPDSATSIEILWGEPTGKNPGIVLDQPGSPVVTSSATMLLKEIPNLPTYHRSWREFFHDYHTPLIIKTKLDISIPDLPGLTIQEQTRVPNTYLNLFRAGNQRELLKLWSAQAGKPAAGPQVQEQVYLVARTAVMNGTPQLAEALLSQQHAPEREDQLYSRWYLLLAYSYAENARPYLSLATLDDRLPNLADDHPLFAAYTLLRAENLLAVGQTKPAIDLLSSLRQRHADFQAERIEVRLADASFKANPGNTYSVYLRLLDQENPELWNSYSLEKFGRLAVAERNWQLARRIYQSLETLLPEEADRNLAYFAELYCSYMLGDELGALEKLTDLELSAAGTEAELRCRLRILDHWLPKLSQEMALDKIQQYISIIPATPNFALREEAAFKIALVYVITGDRSRAIKQLETILEEFTSGQLTGETQALLVELLPAEISKLINDRWGIKALSLLERHKALLSARRLEKSLLIQIACAYLEVGLPDKARRIHLYLLAEAKNSADRAKALYLLASDSLADGHFPQALHDARSYLAEYPHGKELGKVLRIMTSAINEGPDPDGPEHLQRLSDPPKEPQYLQWDAKRFWRTGRPAETLKYLTMSEAITPLPPQCLLLKAEAAFRLKHYSRARVDFEKLLDNPQMRDQATYRLAEIMLVNNFIDDARALLEELVMGATSPRWQKLAQLTLNETSRYGTSNRFEKLSKRRL